MTFQPGDCVRFHTAYLAALGMGRETVSGWARGTVVAVRGRAITVEWSAEVRDTHEAEALERALPRAFGSHPPKEAA